MPSYGDEVILNSAFLDMKCYSFGHYPKGNQIHHSEEILKDDCFYQQMSVSKRSNGGYGAEFCRPKKRTCISHGNVAFKVNAGIDSHVISEEEKEDLLPHSQSNMQLWWTKSKNSFEHLLMKQKEDHFVVEKSSGSASVNVTNHEILESSDKSSKKLQHGLDTQQCQGKSSYLFDVVEKIQQTSDLGATCQDNSNLSKRTAKKQLNPWHSAVLDKRESSILDESCTVADNFPDQWKKVTYVEDVEKMQTSDFFGDRGVFPSPAVAAATVAADASTATAASTAAAFPSPTPVIAVARCVVACCAVACRLPVARCAVACPLTLLSAATYSLTSPGAFHFHRRLSCLPPPVAFAGLVITLRLTKENYFSWSPAMTMGIAGRGRMTYIDGSNPEPAKTSVRSQILNSGEVFSIEDVYSCIEAEEQRRLVTTEGKRDLMPYHERSALVSRGPGGTTRSLRRCTHCKKTGHTVDYCWDLHPEKKGNKGRSSIGKMPVSEVPKSSGEKLSISADQIRELKAYLGQIDVNQASPRRGLGGGPQLSPKSITEAMGVVVAPRLD
ncbi:hypothetical protein EJ110_NYTH33370 [Nymphaea thermarum]|nr:hypothetical protein EJ110_NYTH33370 [Nymphaea thermarum]